MPGTRHDLQLRLRSARPLLRRQVPLRQRLGPLESELVFVVGCPRSGTTFLGHALGSLPGFVELGEVAALKGAIPELAVLPQNVAASRARRILTTVRLLGLVPGLRGVEHTPETSFIIDVLAKAYPEARFVHIVRDGRDVACSLRDTGWLRAKGRVNDGLWDQVEVPRTDAPRFWVEPARAREFPRVSEARRCAWAWRRYVSAVRAGATSVFELRYERLSADPVGAAVEVARFLDAPEEPLEEAFRRAHGNSIGRHERDLAPDQHAEVLAECGELLRELDYETLDRPSPSSTTGG